jgi:hypothetical protein
VLHNQRVLVYNTFDYSRTIATQPGAISSWIFRKNIRRFRDLFTYL